MKANSFGNIFCLTTFGESHGKAIGGVIDGCPSGIYLDTDFIIKELERRKPGRSNFTSTRNESDEVEFLSGLFNGVTTGTPIAFMIKNNDCKPSDYENLKEVFRPSHADFTYQEKYGIRDFYGGGRSSARTLLPCVVAGAVAKQVLQKYNIEISSVVIQIGQHKNKCFSDNEIESILNKVKDEKDTVGAVVHGTIKNIPVGLGEPMFQKFQAVLAQAMFSINAVKGFEYGAGFEAASMKGSECNDGFVVKNGQIRTSTNNSGGIQGGITNGEDICFNVAFKPIPTLMRQQETVDIHGNKVVLEAGGRHDVCAVPRALPVVEAMAALVTVDFLLYNELYKFKSYASQL